MSIGIAMYKYTESTSAEQDIAAALHPYFLSRGIAKSYWVNRAYCTSLTHYTANTHHIGYSSVFHDSPLLGVKDSSFKWIHTIGSSFDNYIVGHTLQKSGFEGSTYWHHFDEKNKDIGSLEIKDAHTAILFNPDGLITGVMATASPRYRNYSFVPFRSWKTKKIQQALLCAAR